MQMTRKCDIWFKDEETTNQVKRYISIHQILIDRAQLYSTNNVQVISATLLFVFVMYFFLPYHRLKAQWLAISSVCKIFIYSSDDLD